MSWCDLAFLHWPADPKIINTTLPKGLIADTYRGQAYLAIVPFQMAHVAPLGFPPLRSLSFFLELNVRTYVRPKAGGVPGVYFYSLDCNHPVAIELARIGFGLRYFRAKQDLNKSTFESHRQDRRGPPGTFSGTYGPVGEAETPHSQAGNEDNELLHFLTERYWLYARHPILGLLKGQVHHGPWPLVPGYINDLKSDLLEGHGLSSAVAPGTVPLVHYSRRIDVVAWPPAPVF
jgi:uncharacterized protein YqjF (DUF2071 family)